MERVKLQFGCNKLAKLCHLLWMDVTTFELLSVLLQNGRNQPAVRILNAMNKLSYVICSGIWMDVTVRTVDCAPTKRN